MKLVDKIFGRTPQPMVTGRAIRSTVANPGDAALMREMTDLSTRLMRSTVEYNERMLRSYDAAEINNWNLDFKQTYGTANTEIFTYFYRVWGLCRTIAKDFPHGKSIVRAHCDNVVGHDPFALTVRIGERTRKPHPKTKQPVVIFDANEELNLEIMTQWRRFCRPDNFTIRRTISMMEAMMQVEAEAVTVGGCLIRLWDGFPGNEFGFAVDLLEVDRLDPNWHGYAPETGNPIRASIERHPVWDYPVAYWIRRHHPGAFVEGQENFPGPKPRRGEKWDRERVDANDIIHYNNIRLRAEQDLGFTELEACVQSIYMNFKYAGALTQASLASCCKPWVIEKDTPTGMTFTPDPDEMRAIFAGMEASGQHSLERQGLNPVKGQQGDLPQNERMSPAMTKVLEWGFKMKVLDPKFPIEAAHEFRMDNNKEIAAAAGVAYAEMTGDYQSLGYIAAQMSQAPSRAHYMVHQENIKAVVMHRIFKRFLRAAVMAGKLSFGIEKVEEYSDAAVFKAKRWPFTDALREVQALVLKLDARLISPQQAQDEMPDGIDYADVIAMISEAHEIEETHGLVPLDFDPTSVVVKDTIADPGDDADAKAQAAADGDGGIPATNKPSMPKGSKTAKGQKTGKVRSRLTPEKAMEISELLLGLGRNGNGNGEH